MGDSQALLISTAAYRPMARDLVRACMSLRPIDATRTDYPDGERSFRLPAVAGQDVVLLGGTISDADSLELFDLACGLVAWGARTLTLVIPYFGYSTMERASAIGEVVTAKTRALLLSAIPRAAAGNRVFLVDLHAEGIPHYFEGSLRPFHLYAKPVILDAIARLGGSDFVLASTDAGRAKWVESLAHDLGVDTAFIIKRRTSGSAVEVAGLSAGVRDRHVVIYDDMIRTGGSLLAAAKAYRAAGAQAVSAVATHGVLPRGTVTRLLDSGQLDTLVVTDSHPAAEAAARDEPRLVVRSIASVLAEGLDAI